MDNAVIMWTIWPVQLKDCSIYIFINKIWDGFFENSPRPPKYNEAHDRMSLSTLARKNGIFLSYQTTYNHKSTTNHCMYISLQVEHKNLATIVVLKKRSFGLSCFYFHYVNCVHTTNLKRCKNHFVQQNIRILTKGCRVKSWVCRKNRTSASEPFYIPCDEISQNTQTVKLSQSVVRTWMKALVPLLYYIFPFWCVVSFWLVKNHLRYHIRYSRSNTPQNKSNP